jgi:hypothetical protein
LILLYTLLSKSGYELVLPFGNELRQQTVKDVIVSVARGSTSLEELTDWFKARLRKSSAG